MVSGCECGVAVHCELATYINRTQIKEQRTEHRKCLNEWERRWKKNEKRPRNKYKMETKCPRNMVSVWSSGPFYSAISHIDGFRACVRVDCGFAFFNHFALNCFRFDWGRNRALNTSSASSSGNASTRFLISLRQIRIIDLGECDKTRPLSIDGLNGWMEWRISNEYVATLLCGEKLFQFNGIQCLFRLAKMHLAVNGRCDGAYVTDIAKV